MAASEEFELKASIMAGIQRQFEALASQWGTNAPVAFPDPGLGGGSFLTDIVPAFATGYNSGTGRTTMPFTTDVSILTNGTTGDILTG